ncbi:hypothetical protein I203_106383 [Kwoniella mangroviensis CBS 8507]|uniref:uncharacterized protein n=1 Tax=Kwoniella mangroviensis CBS 8507 TaxID=1296122 RepID=UPI00305EA7F3
MATLVKEWEGAILQKNTRAEDVRRGTKEGERSKDPPEYHSDRGNQIGGPPTRGPPPRKSAPFEPEDSAIQVLHQLCVFEQVLQEVIAEKDGLKISPIRASLRIELYFEDIIKPFLVKVCATDIQLKKKDNIVPEHWLKLIEKSFLSFLSIGSLHLQS